MSTHYVMESAPGPETVISGQRYLYFGGTSYYGLHNHPQLIEAGISTWRKLGTNTATSRRGAGTAPVHSKVETAAARFFETDHFPIQEQLEKLEGGGVIVSREVGRTVLYEFNPRYAFLQELKAILEKAISFYPDDLLHQRG